MKFVSALIVLAMSCLAFAAPTSKPVKMKWVLKEGAPAVLQKVIDNQPRIRLAKVKLLRERISELKDEKRHWDKSASAQKRRKDEIAAIQDEIKFIESDNVIVVPTKEPKSPGEVGLLSGVGIQQVRNESEAIITVSIKWPDFDINGSFSGKEQDVFDAWVSGIDTKSWSGTRGNFRAIDPVITYCESMKTYDVANGGTRTVPLLVAYPVDCFVRVPVEPSTQPCN